MVDREDAEDRVAARHVAFQLKMMAAQYGWTMRFYEEARPILTQTCLEATLVRMRVLIEFLMGRPRADGRYWDERDVGATDFVADWNPSNRLDEYLDRIDKRIVHMTEKRATAAQRGSLWALGAMADNILIEFQHFVDALERAGGSQAPAFREALGLAASYRAEPLEEWPSETPA